MGLMKKNLSIILDLVRKEKIDKEDAIDLIEGLYNKSVTYTYPWWTTSIYDTSKNTITTSYKSGDLYDTNKNTVTTSYSGDINCK